MIDLKNVDKVLQNVTGKDFLIAERQARQMGDQTASIVRTGFSEGQQIRRAAIGCSINTNTDIEFFINEPLSEFLEWLNLVSALCESQR